MKYIKRLVLWLFHRWYEVEVRPVPISINIFDCESMTIPIGTVSRIITRDDYKTIVGPYTGARFAALVELLPGVVHVVVDNEAEHLDRLEAFIAENGIISVRTTVAKNRIDEQIICHYEIKERRIQ